MLQDIYARFYVAQTERALRALKVRIAVLAFACGIGVWFIVWGL